ncbi:MAG: oligosaccharide flippase family protein [Bacteroidales bacterium]|nr:oligosaccharide flippase family protein [Bacteroidales bacterium]
MNRLSFITKNEFVKNVFTLITGSALGQFFILVITPILTRLYSDELFGVYFIFISTINILKKVTTLRLELAIILPKKNFWAINAFALSIFFTITTSVLFYLIAIIFKDLLSTYQKTAAISNYLLIIPITLFFIGTFETFSAWNNRNMKYKKISIGKITLNISTGTVQIGTNYFLLNNSGLVIGYLVGQIVAALLMILMTTKELLKHIKNISPKRMKILLIRYKKIPTFNTLINFATNLSNEIPVYLLTGFFSTSVAGFYGMAYKIVGTPFSMLGGSIGQVFYQKASVTYSNKVSLKPLIKKTTINLLKISILPIIFIAGISPFIHYIFGEEWKELTFYILILLPAMFINFLSQPITSVPTITNQQNILLYWLIITFIAKFLSIWISYKITNNPYIALISLSVVSAFLKTIVILWIYKSSE